MRWRQGRRSAHVEDRRGAAPPRARGRVALGGGSLLLLLVVGLLFGADPAVLLEIAAGGGATPMGTPEPAPPPSAQDDEAADFVSVVLADTEDVWTRLFAAEGARYEPPRLVLYRDAVESACGFQSAAVGPFYCPGDRRVYLDLSFFDDLARRFGAPGDFAQAYVIAHEVGHHVQTLTGTSERVSRRRRGLPEAEANALSVKQELQADCYAGLWAGHADRARALLEAGDVEEGLRAGFETGFVASAHALPGPSRSRRAAVFGQAGGRYPPGPSPPRLGA